MIAPMQPWDLVAVAVNVRPEDREDFAKVFGEFDWQRWVCQRATNPGIAFTIFRDRTPVACFGFLTDLDPTVCMVWLLATARGREGLREGVRAFRKAAASGEFRVIQATCRKGRPRARAFLEWLGFTCRGEIPSYCHDGDSLELFSIETGARHDALAA